MGLLGGDRLSGALTALAHPVRRDLLSLLEGRAARVTDLASRFAISLPAVSRHVRVLEAAGFVTRRITGRDHFIEARPEAFDEVKDWIAARSAEWDARLTALKALMEEGYDG
jgi:DNA-binding transcriptional ArsR family regulator